MKFITDCAYLRMIYRISIPLKIWVASGTCQCVAVRFAVPIYVSSKDRRKLSKRKSCQTFLKCNAHIKRWVKEAGQALHWRFRVEMEEEPLLENGDEEGGTISIQRAAHKTRAAKETESLDFHQVCNEVQSRRSEQIRWYTERSGLG